VRFIAGDETKASLRDRGLTFEMILSAPVLGFIPNPARHGQMLLIIEISGYAHAAPCERRGDAWRIITAFPSRKYHKHFLP
jgi:hypothetical protein